MRGRRGQVSAELILLIAAVLAVALILVVQLQKTAEAAGERAEEKTQEILKAIDDTSPSGSKTSKKSIGSSCSDDSDCSSGFCDWTGKCA